MVLPGDCYRIVLTTMCGYFAFSAIYEWIRYRIEARHVESVDGVENQRSEASDLATLAWHKRWMFAGPLLVIVLICGILLIIVQRSEIVPFMYTGF